MTEITEHIDAAKPILFFDGQCRLCVQSRDWFAAALVRAGVQPVSLHDARAAAWSGVSLEERSRAILLVVPGEKSVWGCEALLWIANRFVLLQPLVWFCRRSWILPLLMRSYAELAARRYCPGDSTSCEIFTKRKEML